MRRRFTYTIVGVAGRTTAVTLDSGFVSALESLRPRRLGAHGHRVRRRRHRGRGCAAALPRGRTLSPLEVNESSGTATLEGTTVKLKAEAAELLNETFGIQDLE